MYCEICGRFDCVHLEGSPTWRRAQKKVIEYQEPFDPGVAVVTTLEEQTGKTIFTIRFREKDPNAEKLEVVVAFTDKTIMEAEISTLPVPGTKQLGLRIRGKFID